MNPSVTFSYLHGFASGPGSTKAQFFRARIAEHGIALEIPDLAPDFAHMTVTGMLGSQGVHGYKTGPDPRCCVGVEVNRGDLRAVERAR